MKAFLLLVLITLGCSLTGAKDTGLSGRHSPFVQLDAMTRLVGSSLGRYGRYLPDGRMQSQQMHHFNPQDTPACLTLDVALKLVTVSAAFNDTNITYTSFCAAIGTVTTADVDCLALVDPILRSIEPAKGFCQTIGRTYCPTILDEIDSAFKRCDTVQAQPLLGQCPDGCEGDSVGTCQPTLHLTFLGSACSPCSAAAVNTTNAFVAAVVNATLSQLSLLGNSSLANLTGNLSGGSTLSNDSSTSSDLSLSEFQDQWALLTSNMCPTVNISAGSGMEPAAPAAGTSCVTYLMSQPGLGIPLSTSVSYWTAFNFSTICRNPYAAQCMQELYLGSASLDVALASTKSCATGNLSQTLSSTSSSCLHNAMENFALASSTSTMFCSMSDNSTQLCADFVWGDFAATGSQLQGNTSAVLRSCLDYALSDDPMACPQECKSASFVTALSSTGCCGKNFITALPDILNCTGPTLAAQLTTLQQNASFCSGVVVPDAVIDFNQSTTSSPGLQRQLRLNIGWTYVADNQTLAQLLIDALLTDLSLALNVPKSSFLSPVLNPYWSGGSGSSGSAGGGSPLAFHPVAQHHNRFLQQDLGDASTAMQFGIDASGNSSASEAIAAQFDSKYTSGTLELKQSSELALSTGLLADASIPLYSPPETASPPTPAPSKAPGTTAPNTTIGSPSPGSTSVVTQSPVNSSANASTQATNQSNVPPTTVETNQTATSVAPANRSNVTDAPSPSPSAVTSRAPAPLSTGAPTTIQASGTPAPVSNTVATPTTPAPVPTIIAPIAANKLATLDTTTFRTQLATALGTSASQLNVTIVNGAIVVQFLGSGGSALQSAALALTASQTTALGLSAPFTNPAAPTSAPPPPKGNPTMVIIMGCGGGLAVILLAGVIFVAARSGSSKKKGGSRSDGRAEMFDDEREKELLSFEELRSSPAGSGGAPRGNPISAPTRSALQSVGMDG